MYNRTSRVNFILTKMFDMVGDVYSESLELADGWYTKNTWTKETENEFRKWLVSYLRKELKTTKKQATMEAEMFILNYGWKLG